MRSLALALPLLALAACTGDGSKSDADKLDAELAVEKGRDPAITAALEDQIMVDPKLMGQSNANAARPADAPLQAPIPPGEGLSTRENGQVQTLGQRAAAQSRTHRANFNGCGLDVDYSMAWAARLPAELPLYPKARVEEAAGSDLGPCRLRAVSFASAAAPRELIDWYLATARRGGYAAALSNEDGTDMVGGTKPDGGAFYAMFSAKKGGGTVVDLVTNRGS